MRTTYAVCDKAYDDNRFHTYGETINGLIREFGKRSKLAATANKQFEMNNSVRENAVSWAEKVAAHDQRNYLSNTRIMEMMKDMMEHSRMADETEKIIPLGAIFALKFAGQ